MIFNISGRHTPHRTPGEVFSAIELVLRARLGFGLLNMLKLEEDGQHVWRIFTTNLKHYPVSSTKNAGIMP